MAVISIFEVIGLLNHFHMVRQLVPVGHNSVREKVSSHITTGTGRLGQVQVTCLGSSAYCPNFILGKLEPGLVLHITLASQYLIGLYEVPS